MYVHVCVHTHRRMFVIALFLTAEPWNQSGWAIKKDLVTP